MKFVLVFGLISLFPSGAPAVAAEAPWVVFGEFAGLDLAARRGVCRYEGTNAPVTFEIGDEGLLDRLGGPGPAADYAVGDRLIFEFERSDVPARYRLTAVKEEVVAMAGRGECLHVDAIETVRWPRLKCAWAKRDRSETFDADYYLEIAPEARFWKAGKPARFEDLQLGDALLARTRGVGFGRVRVAVDVYLDEASWNQAQKP